MLLLLGDELNVALHQLTFPAGGPKIRKARWERAEAGEAKDAAG